MGSSVPAKATSRKPACSKSLRTVIAACGLGLGLALTASPLVFYSAPAVATTAMHGKPAKAVGAKNAGRNAGKNTGKSAGKNAEKHKPATRSGKRLRNPRLQKILKERLETHDPADGLLGAASFYGYGFQGRRVASGESFDVKAFTAASNRFPVGAWLAVNRLSNGRCVVVRVNDRMHLSHQLRVVDISRAAAERLAMISDGVVLVRVKRVEGDPEQLKTGHCPQEKMPHPLYCPDCPPTDEEWELPEVPALYERRLPVQTGEESGI